ncbi:MAG TPA: hypothetical protein VJH03_21080 [Blastocatellia bacterium]|nr:hypothetical protein [Blastocatellia bacterium]
MNNKPLILVSLAVAAFIGVQSGQALAQEKPRARATRRPVLRRVAARLATAEERARAAEARAQIAETAAGNAARDAKAAQSQAAQALETARRANDAITELQASLARLEQTSAHTVEVLAALKKTDEGPAPGVTSAALETAASAKQTGAPDKQSSGDVTSLSKVPVKIYGSVLLNTNYVDRGSNNSDIPLFAQKSGSSPDQNHQNFNMTARQTRFGLRYEGNVLDGAKLTGVFEFDLFGGKPAVPSGIDFDLFRVRLAYGRIDWAEDSIEAGQDWTVFAPLNPTTLASYATAGFSASGNLFNRIPQIRYEHRERIGGQSKLILTAAMLDPNAGDSSGNPAFRAPGLGERGSLPAFEARIGLATPSRGRESSFGVSGHYSRLLGVPGNPSGTLEHSPIDSYGVSGDLNAWLSSGVRVTGELFHGRALGILSGNIAQSSVVINGHARGINSTGGWFEVHAEAPAGYEGGWKKLSTNAGYGIEANRDQDLLAGLRKRNQTFMINGQYRFAPSFTVALEYRRLLTEWFKQPAATRKLNWASLAFLYSF